MFELQQILLQLYKNSSSAAPLEGIRAERSFIPHNGRRLIEVK